MDVIFPRKYPPVKKFPIKQSGPLKTPPIFPSMSPPPLAENFTMCKTKQPKRKYEQKKKS